MNKRECIKTLISMMGGYDAKQGTWERGWDDAIGEVIRIAEELDEQELTQDQVDKYLHERNLVSVDAMMVHQTGMQNKVIVERPVIPQFVADYIEKWKYERLIMHEWFTFDHDDEDEDKVSKWLYNNDDETNKRREFMLIDAIRYGYEVEKEKRYYIVEKINNSTLMTFELSDVVGEEVIEFVYGYSENETIHFNSKEKAELIAHFVGESLEVEEVTQ